MTAVSSVESEGRPFGRAVLTLAALGAFFYATYGFTNWLAGQRAHVPAIVFAWEKHIPFIAWTIFPYWTTNLFYAGSLLLSRTRAELDTQARRLLTVQVIAITCFILFPLTFSWPKPEVTGFFAFFYDALGAFDKPFNQAPSLHVALTVILFSFYVRLLPPPMRWVLGGWSALVVVSVLTTYQHHLIDIPLGFALGLFCVWLWPFDAPHRLRNWRLTQDPRRRRLAMIYGVSAIAISVLALWLGGAGLWLLWLALSLLCVALAYLAGGSSLFAKAADGRMSWTTRLLLAPYLLGAWINSRAWTANDSAVVEIMDGVSLGRFPSRADLAPYATVIDLTAEFNRHDSNTRWISHPMLDLVAPDAATLRAAADDIEAARLAGPVLVSCALGYGRSVASVAVWLLRTGRISTVDDAVTMLRIKRPRLVINPDQLAVIREAAGGR
jgi:protein-tyrosine phosphatase/membrane-associated phospholipid phosphatase